VLLSYYASRFPHPQTPLPKGTRAAPTLKLMIAPLVAGTECLAVKPFICNNIKLRQYANVPDLDAELGADQSSEFDICHCFCLIWTAG